MKPTPKSRTNRASRKKVDTFMKVSLYAKTKKISRQRAYAMAKAGKIAAINRGGSMLVRDWQK